MCQNWACRYEQLRTGSWDLFSKSFQPVLMRFSSSLPISEFTWCCHSWDFLQGCFVNFTTDCSNQFSPSVKSWDLKLQHYHLECFLKHRLLCPTHGFSISVGLGWGAQEFCLSNKLLGVLVRTHCAKASVTFLAALQLLRFGCCCLYPTLSSGFLGDNFVFG